MYICFFYFMKKEGRTGNLGSRMRHALELRVGIGIVEEYGVEYM